MTTSPYFIFHTPATLTRCPQGCSELDMAAWQWAMVSNHPPPHEIPPNPTPDNPEHDDSANRAEDPQPDPGQGPDGEDHGLRMRA